MTIDADLPETRKPNREWIVWAAILGLMFILTWYVADRSFIRGKLSRDDEVAALNQKLADATLLLSQCKADADLRKPIAEAQRHMADAALEAATNPNKKNSARLSDRLHKLKALRDVPAIAGTTP